MLTLVVEGVREFVTHHDPDTSKGQSPEITERSSHKHLEGKLTGEAHGTGSEVTQQSDRHRQVGGDRRVETDRQTETGEGRQVGEDRWRQTDR